MRKKFIFLNICCIVLIMTGCEKAEKAIQGIEKGKEFIGTAEKKVAETMKEAESGIGEIFGSETAQSGDKKSGQQESKEGTGEENEEKD